MPQSPMASPTDYNPSIFHRELKKIYGVVPQSPTMLPTYITNGITDGLPTYRSTCMLDACPCRYRKVWRDFRTFFVCISINFRRYYRRNLMPLTTIDVRRKTFPYKTPPSPHLVHFFLSAPFLFFSISLLLSVFIWLFEEILLFWW